jgi:Gpi18-like mannosyltransferase
MSASTISRDVAPTTVRGGGDGAWSTALWATYGSRLIVWIPAMVALALFPPSQALINGFDPSGVTHPFHSAVLNRLLAPAGRYDTTWYIGIAQHGYTSYESHAFFPLYPLLIKVVDSVVNQPLIVGLVISMACFTGSLVLLYRLVLLDFSPRVAQLSVWLMALFPMSLYFSAVYTESIFMLLSIWSIYAARKERWWLAGLMAALASATRSDGFVLIIPIVWIYLWGPRPGAPRADIDWLNPLGLIKRARPSILWLALAPVGLVAYLVYCAASGWMFTEPFHAAATYWGRSFKGPFSEIVIAIRHFFGHDLGAVISNTHVHVFYVGDPLNWTWSNVLDVLFLIPLVTALVFCWRRCPRVYFVYSLLIIAASASNPSPLEPMMSFMRYVMPAFPLMVGTAAVLVDRPIAKWSTLTVSSAFLAFFSVLWGIWAWVA